MRGRKPKPNSLKLIQGSRNINPNEPTVSTDLPDCPPIVKGDARKEWMRLVPELHRAGLLTRVDGVAFAAYCKTYARWVKAEKALESEDTIVVRATGAPMVNPAVMLVQKLLDQMLKYLVEFGMTPSSRSRIKAGPPKDDDELTQFISNSGA